MTDEPQKKLEQLKKLLDLGVIDWDVYDSAAAAMRAQLEGDQLRVVRGGSWNVIQVNAHAACRFWLVPYRRLEPYGFRVVSAPV